MLFQKLRVCARKLIISDVLVVVYAHPTCILHHGQHNSSACWMAGIVGCLLYQPYHPCSVIKLPQDWYDHTTPDLDLCKVTDTASSSSQPLIITHSIIGFFLEIVRS